MRQILSSFQRVSPGFTPRPWLSDPSLDAWKPDARVSPGFTPRPWLSDEGLVFSERLVKRVAGVYAPTLVERI